MIKDLRSHLSYDWHMNRARIYCFAVAALAAVVTAIVLIADGASEVPVSTFIFWAGLLAATELLPITLGFETRITMSFPVLTATAVLFPPPVAMLIAGLGSVDSRELRWSLPLHRALFNRGQTMLAVGAASGLLHGFSDGLNPLMVLLAASIFLLMNLGFVAGAVHFERRITFVEAFRMIPPKPIAGFVVTSLLLTALGGATALAYREVGERGEWVVVAILIPLLFARMAMVGAKTQQELSERIRKQQEALLTATETVFQERELERARIAEHIHDTSLQALAAAAYGCANTAALLGSGKVDRAKETLDSAEVAVRQAMTGLREALVDLRRSSVEEGGLMTTLQKFAEQLSTLWGAEVTIEGEIHNEPPIPVALAAFQIVQEGLVNSLKHSQTDHVTVRISEDDSMVHLVVEDEGAGFDPDQQVGSDHVGMTLMRQRAAGVGGEIKLRSHPGEGTRLEAILPAGVSVA